MFEQKNVWLRWELFVRDGNLGFHVPRRLIWMRGFFSENFVISSSYLYSEGKLCCFWRKLFGRFEFPEKNLEKKVLGEVFFISNLLENQQRFYSVLEKKFHQFRQLCILRLRWTILRKKIFLKKAIFSSFLDVGGNVSGFLAKCFPQIISAAF